MNLIDRHQKELNITYAKHNVDTLYIFGSVLSDAFKADSDIDFIVSLSIADPIEYTEHYFRLKFELEQIFDIKIDLLEQKAMRNELFNELVNRKKGWCMQAEIRAWRDGSIFTDLFSF